MITIGKKVYAIGDVHGCYDALMKVMGMIYQDAGDDPTKIVFLGDYADRGPRSYDVIEYLISLKNYSDNPNIEYVFIRGNHDEMYLDYASGRDSYSMMINGGIETKKSYDAVGKIIQTERSHQLFMSTTEYMHREGNFLFVHAAIDPRKELDDQDYDTCTWAREFNLYDGEYPEGVFVVHGHTAVEQAVWTGHQLNIDTGCCFGREWSEYGKLTGVRLHDDGKIQLFQARQYPGPSSDEAQMVGRYL